MNVVAQVRRCAGKLWAGAVRRMFGFPIRKKYESATMGSGASRGSVRVGGGQANDHGLASA
jgi:hypothetical protein